MRDAARRLAALAVGLGLVFLATGAAAQCGGTSLIGHYVSEAPNEIVRMFKRARAVPNAQGRFWEVRRPGLAPSYLFGTFHTAEALETVPARVWRTLGAARVAIFEVDLAEKAALDRRMETDLDFVIDRSSPPLAERLPADARAPVAEALEARGLSLEGAAQVRPWLLMSLLGFPVCQLRSVAEGEEPMDVVMALQARDAGVPILGLESYTDSIAAFQRIPRETLMAGIVSAARTEDIAEDLFRTHADFYAAGDIQAIAEFAVWLGERTEPEADVRAINDTVMTEILDARNLAWMPALLRELGAGGAFVAVGALHMPGDAGLVELIRAEGFDVHRLDGS